MARVRLSILLAAVLAATPATASQTLCSFYPANGPLKLGIEFIGYDDQSPMIQFDLAQGPHSIPAQSYTLKYLDSKARRVHLVYRNPGDPDLPPSFVLKGIGDKVVLTIGKNRATGELRCGS